jgi:hypothetical protein
VLVASDVQFGSDERPESPSLLHFLSQWRNQLWHVESRKVIPPRVTVRVDVSGEFLPDRDCCQSHIHLASRAAVSDSTDGISSIWKRRDPPRMSVGVSVKLFTDTDRRQLHMRVMARGRIHSIC